MNNKKNKKLFIIIIILILAFLIGGVIVFNKDEKENIKIDSYIAYIKINPLIKLEYSIKCTNNKCANPIVNKYELLNDDAKNIYKEIDLLKTNNNLYEVINLFSKTAKDNNIEFENIEIYSDWNNLNNYLNNNTSEEDFKWNFIINIKEKDDLPTIEDSLINEKIIYNITFDTNGGNDISSQTIIKGDKIIKPNNPIKNGYEFIEWQLNNEPFDFNTIINENITLKAVWKEIENIENKEDSTNEISKTIKLSGVLARNQNKNYKYSLSEDANNIILKITGKKDEVNKIEEDNIKQYIDLSNLKPGTHSVMIKTDNLSLKHEFTPNKIKVIITDPNNEETQTPVNTKLNLNENIEYLESSYCGSHQYVNPSCVNVPVSELIKLYPAEGSAYQDFIQKEYDNCKENEIEGDTYCDDIKKERENSIIPKGELYSYTHIEMIQYFSKCVTIPYSVKQKFNELKGYIADFREKGSLSISLIHFKESKYYEYMSNDKDISKLSIYNGSFCGDSGEYKPTYKILDEATCNKFHLECERK